MIESLKSLGKKRKGESIWRINRVSFTLKLGERVPETWEDLKKLLISDLGWSENEINRYVNQYPDKTVAFKFFMAWYFGTLGALRFLMNISKYQNFRVKWNNASREFEENPTQEQSKINAEVASKEFLNELFTIPCFNLRNVSMNDFDAALEESNKMSSATQYAIGGIDNPRIAGRELYKSFATVMIERRPTASSEWLGIVLSQIILGHYNKIRMAEMIDEYFEFLIKPRIWF